MVEKGVRRLAPMNKPNSLYDSTPQRCASCPRAGAVTQPHGRLHRRSLYSLRGGSLSGTTSWAGSSYRLSRQAHHPVIARSSLSSGQPYASGDRPWSWSEILEQVRSGFFPGSISTDVLHISPVARHRGRLALICCLSFPSGCTMTTCACEAEPLERTYGVRLSRTRFVPAKCIVRDEAEPGNDVRTSLNRTYSHTLRPVALQVAVPYVQVQTNHFDKCSA
ncbi:hypothetical protein BAUCODRAFT_36269 [Baudoinia panamericana UAMH 10762]|uniref:Uncharacterized protein n=1 Tax=Baudoinia panamericana (strain UAMH 10762) TaxID=717646 RepID=M2N468_BAUPA|nr:uncharacterized protein BAUCODRAFT_36269 [Baudoinia panamericana UAMH 10762]EMC93814.1 hypothetical protein BAUCODRAFT_36269 [Baudoinia panamericana UAMH 10762]